MTGEDNQILLGTNDPKSHEHCKGVFGIDTMSNPAMATYAKAIYRSIFEYYMNNVSDRLFK